MDLLHATAKLLEPVNTPLNKYFKHLTVYDCKNRFLFHLTRMSLAKHCFRLSLTEENLAALSYLLCTPQHSPLLQETYFLFQFKILILNDEIVL